ncbi:MAG TPA: hypothetical protein VGK20_09010 [Candidatus Binatia bacterium]
MTSSSLEVARKAAQWSYRRTNDGGFSHSNMITVLDRESRIVHRRIGLGGDVAEAVAAVRAQLPSSGNQPGKKQ